MEAIRQFAFCPRCGASSAPGAQASAGPTGPYRCGTCGFTLFFNAASAVAAIIRRDDGHSLFIRRAKDPGKGLLGMPGGFVDPGESAEDALRREVREEVGLSLATVTYLSSHANRYPYAGVTYPTIDLFFVCRANAPDRAEALDAVESVVWLDPLTVSLDEIAFDSMRAALRILRERG